MRQLSELFARATTLCQQFTDLLDREKQALLDQDMTALQGLLDEKSAAMAALNDVHAEMTAQLQAAGMPEELSPGDFIRGLGDDQLSRQHADFLDAARACEEANLRNARLIRHSQHVNSNLLDLLRNQGETSLNVYDRLGNANRARPGRPISRA